MNCTLGGTKLGSDSVMQGENISARAKKNKTLKNLTLKLFSSLYKHTDKWKNWGK